MRLTGLLVVVGLAWMAATLPAQGAVTGAVYFGEESPRFAFSLRLSGVDISGIPFRAGTYFPEELDFDRDLGYGGAAEYYITPALSLELAFDQVLNEDTYGGAQSVDLSIKDWAVSVKYTFLPTHRLRPYVLGGIDWFDTSIDYSQPSALVTGSVDSAWGWHMGGGAEFRFTDDVGLFAEVRYRVGSTDVDTTVWYPTGAWSSRNEIEYDGLMGTVGVKLYW